ncbi:MAG: hypothetical protein ABFS39_19665 [Pseudomonadota bacterium]
MGDFNRKITNPRKFTVISISPVIVNAADFDLAQGVMELTKIAELPVISAAVPVTLSFVFDKEP